MKTVKIGKHRVPVGDVLSIKTVKVSDELVKEIHYRLFEPTYHEVHAVLSNDEGYEIEKIVRRETLS